MERERLLEFDKNWLYISIPDNFKLKGLLTHLLEQWRKYNHPLWETGEFNKFMTVDHKLTHIKDVFLFASRLYFDITRRCGKKDFLKNHWDKLSLIIAIWLHDWGNHGPIFDPTNESQDIERLNILVGEYGGDRLSNPSEMDDQWVRMNHAIITYFNIKYYPEKVGLDLLDRMTGDASKRDEIAALCLHQKRILLDEKKMGLNSLLRLFDACDEIWNRLISLEHLDYKIWKTTFEANKIWKKIADFLENKNLHKLGIDPNAKKIEELKNLCYKRELEKALEITKDDEVLKEINGLLNKCKHYQFKKHVIPKMAIKDVYFYNGEIIIVPFFKEFASENDPDVQETLRKIRQELEEGEKYLKLLGLPFNRNSARLWRRGDPEPEELEVRELKESLSTYEVRNAIELAELENKGDFLESPIRGKFIDKSVGWKELKEKVLGESFNSFEWEVNPPDVNDTSFRVFFITGKYGVGKSTFMLYWLDRGLSSERSWFNSVVFLDPNEMGSEEGRERILEDLNFNIKEDPENIILAVDALYREGDTKDSFEKKYQFLKELSKRFRIIVTLGDSHFELLRKFPMDFYIKTIRLKPTKKSTETILLYYLDLYGVGYDRESPEFEEAISLLHQKKDGNLPYYIHHLVKMLYSMGRKFSKEVIEEIPEGMIELILYTIDKEFILPEESTIPLIFFTLLKQRRSLPLSFHFLIWTAKKYSKKENLDEVKSKLEVLRTTYLDSKPFKFGDGESIKRYQFDDIWKISLEQMIKEPGKFSRFKCTQYFSGIYERYDNFKHDLAINLGDYLESTFKGTPSYRRIHVLVNLLVDLAKFDNTRLPFVTELFIQWRDIIPWSDKQVTYIKNELSLTWFVSAVDLRNEGKLWEAEKHLEEAIKIKEDFKHALHLYVYLLQRRLPEVPQEEREILINRIQTLYSRLESFGPDPITWQTKALFYKEIGEYKKAEELFEKSIIFFPEHVPIIQAFAIFCEERGNKLWMTTREEAEKYIKKAYELYEKGRLEAKKRGFSEKELLNAYANFLRQLAGWKDMRYERIFGPTFSAYEEEKIRIELDAKVDDIFDEVTQKYPDHAESRNSYADFLMDIAGVWLKERYPNNLNIEKAEKLLKDFLEDNPVSQNIFARICQEKGQFDISEYWFDKSISNPKVSLLKNSQLHVAICRHNKGKLYMAWADKLEGEQRQRKIKLAEENLHMAKKLPENNLTYHHLSDVHASIAYLYAKYYKSGKRARTHARKSFDFAKKAEWININFIRRLVTIGEEIIEKDPRRALYFYEVAAELDENNYWAHFRKAQCHANIDDWETAIYEYCKSAKIQNTLKGYYSTRKGLEMIKEKLEINNESLWVKCLKSIEWCLERILQLEGVFESKNWRNYIDYAKNLMEYGVFLSYTASERAIEYFKKALENLEKVKNVFQDTRIIEEYNLLQDYENICKKWIEKLEQMKGRQLLKIDQILILSQETYVYFGDIRRACGFLEEYLELLFPFLDCKELSKIGRKFLEWKKYIFALKCYKEIIKLDPSLENLRELVNVNMKLGRFEEGINNISDYKHVIKTKEEEKDISWLLRRCQSAINVKEAISDGLMLLIRIGKVTENRSPLEVAKLFYQTGKKLHQLKNKINLRPLIYSLADRRISNEELNSIRKIIIPQYIIKSCLWKAKELDPSFSREMEQVLCKFKKQPTESYLYAAEQLRKEAEEAEDIVEIAKYMKAAFYYSYFLAIKTQEIKENNKELSKLWGKTGGSLVEICNSSSLKISRNVLIECFRESINYDNENRESWGQLGRQLFCMGDLDKAKIALEKSGNRYSLTTLGEIAELEGNKPLARDYYVKTSELIGQSEETKAEEKVEEYKNVAEKLIILGFMAEAVKIYEAIRKLSSGRKRVLIEAKIQLLKMKIGERY